MDEYLIPVCIMSDISLLSMIWIKMNEIISKLLYTVNPVRVRHFVYLMKAFNTIYHWTKMNIIQTYKYREPFDFITSSLLHTRMKYVYIPFHFQYPERKLPHREVEFWDYVIMLSLWQCAVSVLRSTDCQTRPRLCRIPIITHCDCVRRIIC